MTRDEIRVFVVESVEQWALGTGRLVILEGADQTTIASIGPSAGRRRRA